METTTSDYKKQINNLNARASATLDKAAGKAKEVSEEILNSPQARDLAHQLKDYRQRSAELYDASVDRVRENPMTALAIAAGVGFLAGFVMRSRR